MALVVFSSKVAGDIVMFAENACRIFEILGRPESPRGVITAAQVPDALQRLTAAVEQDKAQQQAADNRTENQTDNAGDGGAKARGVTFSQRAFPLLEMLRAAQKKNADVTWGT